jgi:DNA-binding XRE family transcriptional regulator
MNKPHKPKLHGIHRAVEMFDNSPAKLARAIGVSRQKINSWIKNGNVPSTAGCNKLFHVTRIPVTEFNPNGCWHLILNGAHPPVPIPPLEAEKPGRQAKPVFKRATGEVVPDQRKTTSV